MNANPKGRPLSATELALAERRERLAKASQPIADPLLAEISEDLHRICMAQSLDVAQWTAGDAIKKLRKYAAQLKQSSNQ
jgi:hypothetical protein